MNTALNLSILGLTAIAITAMVTNHDGMIVQACVGGILTICGYAMIKLRNGNTKDASK